MNTSRAHNKDTFPLQMFWGNSVLMRSTQQIHCNYYMFLISLPSQFISKEKKQKQNKKNIRICLKIGAKPRRSTKIRTHNNKNS